MSSVEWLSLEDTHTVVYDPTIQTPISDACKKKVDTIFEQGKETAHLFDNFVMAVSSFSPSKIIVKKVPYRFVYASLKDAKIRKQLSIYPLGVTGVIESERGILLAKRSSLVATDKELYECCPSGIVDFSSVGLHNHCDVTKCLCQESQEELSLRLKPIFSPLGALWTKKQGIFDICFHVKVQKEIQIVLRDEEYSGYLWCSAKESRNILVSDATKKILSKVFLK